MLNKISKKEHEQLKIKISSEVYKLIKILFDIRQTPESWLNNTVNQLKKIDSLVYGATLKEDSISTESYLVNKAMMMRQKIQRTLNENKPIQDKKDEFFEVYSTNIMKYISERTELVDKTIETLEDNYKTFDDKIKEQP